MVILVHRSRRRRCAGVCGGSPSHTPHPPCRRYGTTLAYLTLKYLPRCFACVLINLKRLKMCFFRTFPLPPPLTLYPQGDAQSISCVAPGEPDNALQLMHRVLLHAENNVILRDYQSAGAPSGIPPRGNGRPFPHRLGECIGNGVQSPSLFLWYGRAFGT